MTDQLDLDGLEALARAAYRDYGLADIAVGGGFRATVSVPAFIQAASPATVLSLITRLRAAEAATAAAVERAERAERDAERLTVAFDEAIGLSWKRLSIARDRGEALTWALAEIDGETSYDADDQRAACLEKARAALPSTPVAENAK